MEPTSPTTAEIRAAIALIHRAVREPDSQPDPAAIREAHTILCFARVTSGPPVAHWLAAYLEHDVWHSGPRYLATAIDELAAHFKMPYPIPSGLADGDQGTLF